MIGSMGMKSEKIALQLQALGICFSINKVLTQYACRNFNSIRK